MYLIIGRNIRASSPRSIQRSVGISPKTVYVHIKCPDNYYSIQWEINTWMNCKRFYVIAFTIELFLKSFGMNYLAKFWIKITFNCAVNFAKNTKIIYKNTAIQSTEWQLYTFLPRFKFIKIQSSPLLRMGGRIDYKTRSGFLWCSIFNSV